MFKSNKFFNNLFYFLNICLIIQGEREISAIILTDDYLCYKEPKILTTFLLNLIFNELFNFKTSDKRQH